MTPNRTMQQDTPVTSRSRPRLGGFSPIETLGAVGVVGMLAASVLPNVFSLVTNSRLNGATQSYMIVKAAAQRYLDQQSAKNPGKDLGALAEVTDAATHWDSAVLQPAGFLDLPFTTKISEEARLEISRCPEAFCNPTGKNNAYSFSGFTPTANNTTAQGKVVVEAVLEGVALSDARAINRRIDGEEPIVGEVRAGTDLSGRVKYEFGDGKQGTVRIYVTHR